MEMMTVRVDTIFKITDTIQPKDTVDNVMYIITDIIYSTKLDTWFYRYSYWEDGYEHFCENTQKWVEANMKLKELAQC